MGKLLFLEGILQKQNLDGVRACDWASLVAQMVKNLPAMWKNWVHSLRWENPLEEDILIHSSILAWRIPMDRGAWCAIVRGIAKSQI